MNAPIQTYPHFFTGNYAPLTEEYDIPALRIEGTLPPGLSGSLYRVGPWLHVRLRPRGRADIMDLALEGKEATVVSVEEDLEGRRYVAVTVEDDPGRDLGGVGYPGHRFFFRPEEVEPL